MDAIVIENPGVALSRLVADQKPAASPAPFMEEGIT